MEQQCTHISFFVLDRQSKIVSTYDLKGKYLSSIDLINLDEVSSSFQLSFGKDISNYTVSKILVNREIRTTQVYAKVMDVSKRAAIDRLPSLDR